MSNSMKDLLLGLGFKQPPQEASKPVSKPERNDVSRHSNQRNPSQRQPSQPHNPTKRPDHAPRSPRTEQRARAELPHRAQSQRAREEIDLAKAYAIRAQKEKDERIEAERLKQEAARIKREAKAKVAEILKDKALNAAEADLTRHFEYNGKIRRVHVSEGQLKSLNVGELGVVQLDGRYLLVDAALAREVHALLPNLIALLVDPDAPIAEDPYGDPQYKVPDDLVW